MNVVRLPGVLSTVSARATTGRVGVQNVQLLPGYQGMVAAGEYDKLISQCGTHAVTTVHNGQALRLVIDFSSARSEAKRDLSIKISGKAKAVMFKAKASASYREEFQRLVNSKTLSASIEGSGWIPDSSAVMSILTASAGDLESVKTAIGAILKDHSEKAAESSIPLGYNLEPIYLLDAQLAGMKHYADGNSGSDLAKYGDLINVIQSSQDITRDRLMIVGISDVDKKRLQAHKADLKLLKAQADASYGKCFDTSTGSECADDLDDMEQHLVDARKPDARVIFSPNALTVETNNLYGGLGGLVLASGGKEFYLDTVTLLPGRNVLRLLEESKGPLENNAFVSDAQLTMVALLMMAASKASLVPGSNPIDTMAIGCFTSIGYGPNNSFVRMDLGPNSSPTASPECRSDQTPAVFGVPSGVVLLAGTPRMLGGAIVQIPDEPRLTIPINPSAALYLDMIDETGLPIRILVADFASQKTIDALKSMIEKP